MVGWSASSFWCLAMPLLTTQPFTTMFLCIFWTALRGGPYSTIMAWTLKTVSMPSSYFGYRIDWLVSSSEFCVLLPFDSEERSIPDESDRFMMEPSGFAFELAKTWSLPSHIVLFDSEERKLREFLSLHSFKEVNVEPNHLIPSNSIIYFPGVCSCVWSFSRFYDNEFPISDKEVFPHPLQGGSGSASIGCCLCFDRSVKSWLISM